MRVLNAQVTATTERVILTLNILPFDYEEAHAIKREIEKGGEIEIKRKKEKRSINANSYYWSLINKIAVKIRSTSVETHNAMLRDYGVEWLDGSGNRMFVQLPNSVEYQKDETLHLRPTSKTSENAKGTVYRTYVLLKPSHLYDTKEFSRLLDGAITEARQLGIEIEDDNWIKQIKESWKSVN